MLNQSELKVAMLRKGYTQESLANALGMSSRTFSTKKKNGTFGLDEMDAMIYILEIRNPAEIFFSQTVT